jgi:hypothetical protein
MAFSTIRQFALASGAGDLCFGPLCQSKPQNHNQTNDRKAAHWPTCVFAGLT